MTFSAPHIARIAALAALAISPSAWATFHRIEINEVYTNADGTVQYIELIARANGQTNLSVVQITALNRDGSVQNLVFDFTASYPQLDNGETILIATAKFKDAAGFTPDFEIPADSLIFSIDGRVIFTHDDGDAVDAVAYGDFSGDNETNGTPAAALPCDGAKSLTRIAAGENNAATWTVATSSPKRNDGTTAALNAIGLDCNANGIDDACEIATGSVNDCNANLVPDECDDSSDADGTIDDCDGCPDDADKTAPGACGCGVPDVDNDGDGVLDCDDGCPNDPNKTAAGACGCGFADTDSDGDGTADCDESDESLPPCCGTGSAAGTLLFMIVPLWIMNRKWRASRRRTANRAAR